MSYLSKGYYTVCLSPAVSLIAWPITLWLIIGLRLDWILQIVSITIMHMLVIIVQISGLILCLFGYSKNEPMPFNGQRSIRTTPVSAFIGCLVLNILLILWGGFVIWWAIGWYNYLVEWSRLEEVRSLIIWDHMQYLTWALKGFLWIASGIAFTAMSYAEKLSKART